MSGRNDIQPYWRPDFKVQSTLPDIKVVRTDFIVNSISVALVLIVLFTLLQREYRAYSLRGSISGLEQRLGASAANDSLNLKNSERFRKSAQGVREVQRFFRAPFTAHEILTELSALKPEGVIFSRIISSESIRAAKGKGKTRVEAQIVYSIKIEGQVQGLTVLSEFKGALQALPLLNLEGFGLAVDESIQRRNAETGITPFQMSIKLAPAAGKGAKK